MSYTGRKIFEIPAINSTIDQLYFYIDKLCKDNTITLDINEVFVMSGRCSASLQGEDYSEINQVVFQLNSNIVENFIRNNIPQLLLNKGFVNLKERCIYYFDNFILEIWFTDSVDPYDTGSIFLQKLSSIPENLL